MLAAKHEQRAKVHP